ncbi:putative histone-lysine N-methyltransferase, H3 lysine-79 specific [Podospora fimiseda]|uniref:Histone-lysine N-methyltransferase, H3 lysine-79 specific n=1 Tax=Podospora fimiseda TaxID=252190 RepID=A0AAN7BY10_9PEZI|nr:putative histone-lysine N-methyltransferase, H3 lysine-79 specific [Podospora fimiseda]
MSIFNQKSKFKVKTETRTIKQVVEKKKPAESSITSSASSARASPATTGGINNGAAAARRIASSSDTPRASPNPRSSQHHLQPPSYSSSSGSSVTKKRSRAALPQAGRKSRSPAATASPSFGGSDSDDDVDDDSWQDAISDLRKRQKRAHEVRKVDPNRRVRHPKVWKGDREGETEGLPIIHASEVANHRDKCQPVMGLARDEVMVRLRYPGSNYREKYELVWGKDKIDGVLDIMKVVKHVATTYLINEEEASPFLDQTSGVYRRLEKSKNTNDGNGFKAALRDYSEQLLALQRRGVIAKNLESMKAIPHDLVAFILSQCYDRTVAPRVELLSKYENGTDYVYGELLPQFCADIFDRTNLTSQQVFVDLGSGVANVVLQAALEIGCESWGCEYQENACNLAEAQRKEFSARCRLWGLAPGKVHLERGDFTQNERILEALKRADVVLVNNQAFTAGLNDRLVNMFLDLKIGCKIVSLKSFVHDNKIAENDVASSILDVERLTYPEDYVSWTNAGGQFFISTRK